MKGLRRALVIAALAGCGGFCLAGARAFAYTMLNAWRGYGEQFQLGYVVGYLDAVTLSKRHDPRSFIAVGRKAQYARWRDMVNAYFADPANANRPVPDAMAAVGAQLLAEQTKAWNEQRQRRSPAAGAPSTTPDARATP